jgi:hypothetical protein
VVILKMDLKEVGCGGISWIHLAQDLDQKLSLVNKVRNRRVPLNFGKFFSSWGTVGFSRRTELHDLI